MPVDFVCACCACAVDVFCTAGADERVGRVAALSRARPAQKSIPKTWGVLCVLGVCKCQSLGQSGRGTDGGRVEGKPVGPVTVCEARKRKTFKPHTRGPGFAFLGLLCHSRQFVGCACPGSIYCIVVRVRVLVYITT